jgi:hypothetical protein
MCKPVKTPSDCMDYHKVEKTIKDNGIETRNHGGDHVIMTGTNKNTGEKMSEVYCRRPMGKGLGCQLFKFFVAIGAVGVIVNYVGLDNVINYVFVLLK